MPSSLCVCAITYEGIVIAADSRQTYVNQAKMPRIGSEYGQKVFSLNNRIGATSYGWAFLTRKNIAGLIEDFKVNLPSHALTVEETARKLVDFFEASRSVNRLWLEAR